MPANICIDQLMEGHDADPAAVGRQLRQLDMASVAPADRGRLAWLINHVVGEKEECWAEAFALQLTMPDDELAPPALCCRAVAATLAGDVLGTCAAELALVRSSGASIAETAMAIRLEALEHLVRNSDPVATAAALSHCLHEMHQWESPSRLDRMFAASLNNVVSALLDFSGATAGEAIYGKALADGAEYCRFLWRRVGTWTNHERAEYLVALCHNHLGQWQSARAAACAGLTIIDEHGPEDVDRAFILLELARALSGLGEIEGAKGARSQACDIADAFSDTGLCSWFNARAAL